MKKKKFNLIVTIVVAIALVLSTTVFASAATVKINKKALSLYAGKTTTVKVLNASKKVTWTSSKKTVATVKSTGKASAKITAKKSGTTTITGKIGKKKYTCKVTVKYATGSRQKPADAAAGVTVKTFSGKMFFKVTECYRGNDAVNELKALKEWNTYEEYEYENREAGTDLLLMKYEVKAINGFDEFALTGSDIINPLSIYNGNCNASINDFDCLYLDKNDRGDLSLYEGAEGMMYFCAFVPDDLSSFSTYIYNSAFKQYWIKYNI